MHIASLTAQLDNFGGDPSTIDALFQHFATCIESATTPRDTVHTLLSWATTSTRNRSPWRPALAARLLQLMANRQEKEKRQYCPRLRTCIHLYLLNCCTFLLQV